MAGLVAVTGATGFIGRRLIRRLLQDGFHVRALTRSDRKDEERLAWITGDLDAHNALADLVRNVDMVVHCAGRVRGNSSQQFLHANSIGSKNLIEQVLSQTKPPRFLLLSSLAAREPGLSWYANSKFESERQLIKSGNNLEWSILRPTAVYGPGDREMSPLFRATRYGILTSAGQSNARFGLIYVDDLVQAIINWIKFCEVFGKIYELDDGTGGGYDLNQVKTIASQVWGRPVHLIKLPLALIKTFAGMNLQFSRLIGYSPMLTPGKVRELIHPDWVCDNRPFMDDVAWKPQTRLPEGLRSAVLKD